MIKLKVPQHNIKMSQSRPNVCTRASQALEELEKCGQNQWTAHTRSADCQAAYFRYAGLSEACLQDNLGNFFNSFPASITELAKAFQK